MSVQQVLQAIYDARGELSPRVVVAEAADPEHPLHHRFDWQDSTAAAKWRLHQAAMLIRSVNVVIERNDGQQPIAVRAFVAQSEITGEDVSEGTGRYLPVTEVIADDVKRTAWFQSLRRDWERLKKKAGASQEFAQMVLEDMRDMAG